MIFPSYAARRDKENGENSTNTNLSRSNSMKSTASVRNTNSTLLRDRDMVAGKEARRSFAGSLPSEASVCSPPSSASWAGAAKASGSSGAKGTGSGGASSKYSQGKVAPEVGIPGQAGSDSEG